MNKQPRRCFDCKYARLSWIDRLFRQWGLTRCTHESGRNRGARFEAMVTGRAPFTKLDDFMFCSSNREGACGADAAFFEPRS